MNDVGFELARDLSSEEFIDVLNRSTLPKRRSVDDRMVIEGMLRRADLIVTARVKGLLVGVSRAITGFSYCTGFTAVGRGISSTDCDIPA